MDQLHAQGHLRFLRSKCKKKSWSKLQKKTILHSIKMFFFRHVPQIVGKEVWTRIDCNLKPKRSIPTSLKTKQYPWIRWRIMTEQALYITPGAAVNWYTMSLYQPIMQTTCTRILYGLQWQQDLFSLNPDL